MNAKIGRNQIEFQKRVMQFLSENSWETIIDPNFLHDFESCEEKKLEFLLSLNKQRTFQSLVMELKERGESFDEEMKKLCNEYDIFDVNDTSLDRCKLISSLFSWNYEKWKNTRHGFISELKYSRRLEKENLKDINLNDIFVSFHFPPKDPSNEEKTIDLPRSIIEHILSYFFKKPSRVNDHLTKIDSSNEYFSKYLKEFQEVLFVVGSVCKDFYLICLMSVDELLITKGNLYKIPLILFSSLRTIKISEFSNNNDEDEAYKLQFTNEELNYLWKNLNPQELTKIIFSFQTSRSIRNIIQSLIMEQQQQQLFMFKFVKEIRFYKLKQKESTTRKQQPQWKDRESLKFSQIFPNLQRIYFPPNFILIKYLKGLTFLQFNQSIHSHFISKYQSNSELFSFGKLHQYLTYSKNMERIYITIEEWSKGNAKELSKKLLEKVKAFESYFAQRKIKCLEITCRNTRYYPKRNLEKEVKKKVNNSLNGLSVFELIEIKERKNENYATYLNFVFEKKK